MTDEELSMWRKMAEEQWSTPYGMLALIAEVERLRGELAEARIELEQDPRLAHPDDCEGCQI